MNLIITIIAGVSVYLIGQYILELILRPCLELRKHIYELSALFLHHQAIIKNSQVHKDNDIANELKRYSSLFVSGCEAILWYRFSSKPFGLPSKNNLWEAAKELNGMSYCFREEIPDQSDFLGVDKALLAIGSLLLIPVEYVGMPKKNN